MARTGRTRYPHAFSQGRGVGWVNEGSVDPRWNIMIYNAVAYFSAPVDGRLRIASTDPRRDSVSADTPLAAAYKWYWRLKPAERAVATRIVLWAPRPKPLAPNYSGPVVRFERREGRLVEVAADG